MYLNTFYNLYLITVFKYFWSVFKYFSKYFPSWVAELESPGVGGFGWSEFKTAVESEFKQL